MGPHSFPGTANSAGWENKTTQREISWFTSAVSSFKTLLWLLGISREAAVTVATWLQRPDTASEKDCMGQSRELQGNQICANIQQDFEPKLLFERNKKCRKHLPETKLLCDKLKVIPVFLSIVYLLFKKDELLALTIPVTVTRRSNVAEGKGG